jgi:molecular chaperone DnaK
MTVYGIDLGTCYSCIARDDGAGVVMPVELINNNGKKFVPSVVTFDRVSGQPKVGDTGKACLRTRPECTKAFVKREMDREFCQEDISVAGKKRRISPVEASACILKHLFDGANKVEMGAGRSKATHAVITIPAKFDEQQRSRTKLAAQMAGIQVLGLLNEPTAAAIAYDIPAGNTVLVFDLGGGTLDVSIVTNDRGNYKVIGTPAGDDHLGGMDWDERLIELAFQKVGRRPERNNAKEWNLLMSRAEKIKQALTDNNVIIDDEVDEGNIIEDEEVEIERSEFEAKCQDLLDRCWAVVDKAIANAKAQSPKTKIDFFLTVGGSSRMPMIRKGIIDRYGATYGKGKSETDWLRIKDPDTAIAIGAAKFAQLQLNSKATLEDKATHSYGLKIERDGVPVIKNLVKSSDPIVFSQVFKGLYMNEESDTITIEIYENDIADDYASLNDKAPIFAKDVILNSKKQSGTPLDLSINRDKDGLIKITLTCETVCQSFDVNPPELLIDAETRINIEKSLSLMNTL